MSSAVAHSDDRLPPELVRIASVAGFGSLLLNLSSTTLNVALDGLIAGLHTSLHAAQWAITGYLLALTLVLPLFRWAVERIGLRRLYLGSLLGFTFTSALCATAWSVESLIAFRMIQGAVGGLLTPVAQAVLAQRAGPRYMGRMISIGALPVLIAPLLGPALGGVLVQHLSWRAVFLINLPFGLLCAALCARYLPPDEPGARVAPTLDVLGLALLSPGMALVIFGVTNLRHGGALMGVALPFAIAAFLITVFVVHAWRQPERALIDLRIFRERTVVAALVTYILASIVSFGGQLILPLYFQQVRGQSPSIAGLFIALQGVGMLLTMPRIGRLTDRYDPGKLSMSGVALTLLGTVVFTQAFEGAALIVLGISLVIRGAGQGAINNPALSAVYRSLPSHEIANATAALNIVQRMGAPLGTALMAVLLQWRLSVVPAKELAFTQTFGACAVLTALALVPAFFLMGARTPVTESSSPNLRSSP